MSAQVIGYLGENGVRDVRIPIGHLLDKWQGLRPFLVMVPVGGSDDEAYPVQYTLDGTDLVWHVSDADTAVAGTTKAAVRMVDDSGRVGMDEPFQVIISPNLSAGGEPPVVIKPWVDKLITLVPRAEAAAERAENAAQNWENGTANNALNLGGTPSADYALKTDTVANSNKLGGKTPEHYLPAVNLLDNSRFEIAQAGYGGFHGSTLYAADRWQSNDDETTYQRTSGGLTVTSSTAYEGQIMQVVADSAALVGKTLTYAVKARSEFGRLGMLAYCYDANDNVVQNNLREQVFSELAVRTITFTVPANTAKIRCYINNRAADTYTVEWAALYEGSYTANTLPPFVPRPYAVELAECQRYYYRSWIDPTLQLAKESDRGWVSLAAVSSWGCEVGVILPQAMRVIPDIVLYSALTLTKNKISCWETAEDVTEDATASKETNRQFSVSAPGLLVKGNHYQFYYEADADL